MFRKDIIEKGFEISTLLSNRMDLWRPLRQLSLKSFLDSLDGEQGIRLDHGESADIGVLGTIASVTMLKPFLIFLLTQIFTE